ncbi:MAG: DNA topoisomerase I [Anaerolineae bacterium]|nr:DNA topoisomerase I [Anaerolineae bacterium]
MLKQLIHNGIIIPEPPAYLGLVITVRGQPVQLTPHQEEMALAWAKKQGTDYVEDPVFIQNFMTDFSAALGMDDTLSIADVNFSSVIRVVEAERERKANMSKEERKAQAAVRKAIREELKAKYGHATVNGGVVELGGYLAEPSGIFMGRGEHPLRGRWKAGARQPDITLNLSPDAPRPEGNWQEIVWQPESLWVARWQDKLSDKLKYVWLSDTAPVKQKRETAKFDKTTDLHDHLPEIRRQIRVGLRDSKPRRRMVAMACYLIDVLCLRVGDEKDADEADTVGATTLRPEHVTLHPDGRAEFNFLGKDSVEWHKEIDLPPLVYKTMQELIENARPSSSSSGEEWHPTRDLPQLFPDIGSRAVNSFLSRIQKGLSAKVFRTHHATQVVKQSLAQSGVKAGDPEYKKWKAVVDANMAAAVLCNHTKKATGDWEASQQRYQERLEKAEERRDKYLAQLQEYQNKLADLLAEAEAKIAAAASDKLRERAVIRYEKREATAKSRVETAQERVHRAELAIGKIEAQREAAAGKRTWNLSTSLKSYIDPREVHKWGVKVHYDVIEKYYPTTLRRKFAWVKEDESD